MTDMKRYRAVLLTSAAFSLVATPALADPVSVGTLVVNSIVSLLGGSAATAASIASTAIVGSITVASIVGTTVLTAASIGASFLFANKPKGSGQQQIDPSNAKNSFEIGNSGQLRVIGRARVGGVVAFGNTNNLTRYRIIARCKGPIDAVEDTLLGGRSVTVEENGDVSSPPFARPGGSWINIQAQLGTGAETAYPDVISAFPTLWTTAHRGRGVCHSRVKYFSPGVQSSLYLKLYGSGYPDTQLDLRGELLFDPRDNGTRWSDNGILAVLHILLVDWGFPQSMFDMAFIAAQANKADVLVAVRGGGTEKRSRAWGVWEDQSISRIDLTSQILLSVGAELVQRPGDLIGIQIVDDSRDSDIIIRSRWILDAKLKTGPEGVERPNVCKVKYYSPERNYEIAEINLVQDANVPGSPALLWATVPDEIAKVGRKETEYSLPFCPSASQAQRVARRLFATARAETGIIVTNMAGIGTWGRKTARFEFDELGEVLDCEINPARIDDEAGTCEIPVVVMPVLAPYNPATDEAAAPFDVPDLGFEQSIPQPAISTGATRVVYPVVAPSPTRIRYTVPAGITVIEAVYRGYSAGLPLPWQPMTEVKHGNVYHANTTALSLGALVDFRHRFFNAAEDGTIWSPIFQTTISQNNAAPGTPTLAFFDLGNGDPVVPGLKITAPADLHVAGFVKSGQWTGSVNLEPGEEVTSPITIPGGNPGDTFTWTVRAVSSNGTQSAPVSYTYTVPL